MNELTQAEIEAVVGADDTDTSSELSVQVLNGGGIQQSTDVTDFGIVDYPSSSYGGTAVGPVGLPKGTDGSGGEGYSVPH